MLRRFSNFEKLISAQIILVLINLLNIAELNAEVIVVQNDAAINQLKKQAQGENKTLVLKFFSPKCSHCTKIKGYYANLSNNDQYKHVIFAEVNGTQAPTLMNKYDIEAYPTFMIFKNNGQKEKIRGTNKAQLEATLAK